MPLLLAAGIVDSLALVAIVGAAILNVHGNHPVLSAWAFLLAMVMFVVLAVIAAAERD
jgi:hypothetical protein